MSKINQFDRQSLRALRVDLDTAMATIAAKYGVQLNAGNISFTSETATIKVNACVIRNGTVVTKEAQAFEQYKGIEGLEAFSVGDSVQLGGKQYVIAGYKARSSKNPVCVSRDGRTYRATVDAIKMQNQARPQLSTPTANN